MLLSVYWCHNELLWYATKWNGSSIVSSIHFSDNNSEWLLGVTYSFLGIYVCTVETPGMHMHLYNYFRCLHACLHALSPASVNLSQ